MKKQKRAEKRILFNIMDMKPDTEEEMIVDSGPLIKSSIQDHQQSDENEIPIDMGREAEKDEVIDLTFTSTEAEIIRKSNALSLLAQYSASESDDDEVDHSVYRKPISDSSSSSSSSDSDEEIDIKVIEKKIREPPVESDGDSDDETAVKKKIREPLKVKGELTINDLPPIQDLQITVDERECMEIGVITTIVDQLLLVESFRNSVPLDIDSVLFLDHGKQALGKVFDVIGPVNGPIYCIRFNSNAEILSKGIAMGNKVFYAPRTEHSSFVILSQIMDKGSDASWKNDIEPPDNLVEYSDDEQDRRTRRQAKANRSQNQNQGEHREFVRGRRHLPNQPPHLAYPNYSWHHNLSANQPNTQYGQGNYQNMQRNYQETSHNRQGNLHNAQNNPQIPQRYSQLPQIYPQNYPGQ